MTKLIKKLPPLPPRPSNSHKGTFGTVIILGGSPTMIGAPAFTATAALRAGAGLVKIATDKNLIIPILTLQPSATAIPIPRNTDTHITNILPVTQKPKTVLAVGPGLGANNITIHYIKQLLNHPQYNIVLDADGLNILSALKIDPQTIKANLTLTPHPGEFARLAKAYNIQINKHLPHPDIQIDAATNLAIAFNATVVLKSNETIIANKDQFAINQTGNPALATAGSGDVLTGIIASFIAQGMENFDAAQLASHIHGKAADQWEEQYGPSGLTATDLARKIPETIHTLRNQKIE